MIWNWCTAEVILKAPTPAKGAKSFLWIGDMTILMPTWKHHLGCVEGLTVYEIKDHATLIEAVSLAFESTFDPFHARSVGITNIVLNSTSEMRPRPVPFFPQDSRIIDIGLSLAEWWATGWSGRSNIVLSKHFIQQHYYAYKNDRGSRPPDPVGAPEKPTTPYIPWIEWGPANTRDIDTPPFDHRFGRHALHGNRRVLFRSDAITVLDFTPSLSAWPDPPDASLAPQNGSQTKFFDSVAMVDCVEVDTSLPFRSIKRPYRSRDSDTPDDAMIDAEHILLFDVKEEWIDLVILTL